MEDAGDRWAKVSPGMMAAPAVGLWARALAAVAAADQDGEGWGRKVWEYGAPPAAADAIGC